MPRQTKKWSKLSKKLLVQSKQFRLTGLVALIAVLVVIGAYFILHIHAATCTLGGDANCDGTVNVLDLSVVASNFGKTTGMTWAQGDFNGDGAVNVVDLSILASHWGTGGTTGSAKCGLTNVAFCDTFDAPAGNGNRSGDLNGVVWGVSRTSSDWATPATLYAVNDGTQTDPAPCNNVVTVEPPQDVSICNGQLHEDFNDGGGVKALTMYAKQPFDFAGRTGKVVFDVSNNSGGSHASWPEFWITDQPVPGPFTHEFSWTSYPRNGLGIRFSGCTDSSGKGATCPRGGSVGVDSAITVSNYVGNDSFNGGNILVKGLDSVIESNPGQLNHYEIDVSQNQIDIYGTDAFSGALNLSNTPLRHIATIPNANLNFTRGLIWIEDAHYNGDKFGNQRNNTFTWDNVGFDGPILPRDLTFDVPDNPARPVSVIFGVTFKSLGYDVPASGSTTVTAPGVTGLSNATSAVLLFNFTDAFGPEPYNLNFSINGHAYSHAWPFPTSFPGGLDSNGGTRVSDGTNVNSPLTIALPINLSDLVAGNNTITFTGSGTGYTVWDIDLLLPGAGGIVNP